MFEPEETAGEKIGYGLAAFLLTLLRMPIWIWATLTLWAWFVAPLFPAIPVLTWRTIWGLSLALAMFRSTRLPRRKTDDATGKQWLWWAIAQTIFLPIAVGIGWFIK